MGTRYTNLSSAPRWFKKTLFPILKTSRTTRFTVFFSHLFSALIVSGFVAIFWGGSLLVSIIFLCIGLYTGISGLLSLVFTVYGKPCDASHKGKPWVIEERTSETGRNRPPQALASPVSTGFPKTHQSSREAYSEVLEHDGDDGRSGPYYTDLSSAPRWFKKTLFPFPEKIAILFSVTFCSAVLGFWQAIPLFFVIVGIFLLVCMAYGKQCDASHKGKPWVIEYYEGGGGGFGGGGDGGGCGGGGCGGD